MTSTNAPPRARAPQRAGPLPRVATWNDALRAGVSRHQVQRLLRSGEWRRLTTGVYCLEAVWDSADADERTRLTAAAVSRRWPGTVVSHLSAAALWGLPLPLVPRTTAGAGAHPTWLTAAPSTGVSPRRAPGLVVEVATLPAASVDARVGARFGPLVRATSRARTVADCLRHLGAADAVAIADAAGAAGLSREELRAALAQQDGWPYAARAHAALPLVDPRRESWLESVSSVAFARRGLPVPEPQVEVWTPEGLLIGRADGHWAAHGVVGEADGWAKYRTSGLVSVAQAERALREEKLREDGFRGVGLEVVRWDARGVVTPSGLRETEQRLLRAFERGDPSRVRARLRSTPMPAGW